MYYWQYTILASWRALIIMSKLNPSIDNYVKIKSSLNFNLYGIYLSHTAWFHLCHAYWGIPTNTESKALIRITIQSYLSWSRPFILCIENGDGTLKMR